MITFARLVAAVVLNVTAGRAAHTPASDYLDTVVMDMECDVAPDCSIVYFPDGESAWERVTP